jgi:predicted ATP-dependent serine protease
MKNVVKRKAGRPVGSKKKVIVSSNVVSTWKPELVKMDDLSFDKDLFIPMPTGKKIDELLSSEGGLMRGTNTALIGDPGVGKTTVVLDILADLKAKGQKVLFISGEMNSIDMHGYVKRFPKFGQVPILFLGDYIEKDPLVVLNSVLSEGFDVVMIDSMAEVCVSIVDFHGGTNKNAETQVLNLLEKHNKALNREKKNTAFLIIQQMTKGGTFSGSNRFKHMLTGMACMQFGENGRFISFSKNRRGGKMDRLFFKVDCEKNVQWLHTEAQNAE